MEESTEEELGELELDILEDDEEYKDYNDCIDNNDGNDMAYTIDTNLCFHCSCTDIGQIQDPGSEYLFSI
eukprot:7120085-Ditylum_brightwellii.AAC.1